MMNNPTILATFDLTLKPSNCDSLPRTMAPDIMTNNGTAHLAFASKIVVHIHRLDINELDRKYAPIV